MEESWNCLSTSHMMLSKNDLTDYWEHKKTLSPDSLLRAILTEEVLKSLQRELRRQASVKVDLDDIGNALRRWLNPEVLTEHIWIKKARKERRCESNQGVEGKLPISGGIIKNLASPMSPDCGITA